MPKKKSLKLEKQLNVRVSEIVYESVNSIADKLGIDPSDLVRMILAESLPAYAERARKTVDPGEKTDRPAAHS